MKIRIQSRRICALCIVVCLILAAGIVSAQTAKVATGTRIMIAANPQAAQAGFAVYKKGGNVVDVAVATAYALGVVEPFGSGIGGEGMMVIYNAREGRATVVDFKGISPAGVSYQTHDFKAVDSWNRTIKGASVPGAVAGLELAREKFGKLDRAAVLQPSIDYAIKGFEVDSSLALNITSYRKSLEKDPYARRIYFMANEPAARGTRITNPDYGTTLERIRDDGPDAFYKGAIAELMERDAKTNGGYIMKTDLAAYAPVIREPLRGTYRGYELITTPPPCGGMFLIESLNILKYFDLAECRATSGYSQHVMSETFRLIFKDEATFNGDPAMYKVPVEMVTSQEFAFQRFKHINLAADSKATEIQPGSDTKNTTHLSVMDSEGNAVALTITLSSLFGTGHTVEGAGFMLNNEIQNYNPDQQHPNALAPHKRVVTSLVPTVVLKNGKPVYVLGTPGGDLILSTIAQIIVNLVDFRMTPAEAVFAPRMFATFYQQEMELEKKYPEQYDTMLRSLGHALKYFPDYRSYFGAVQTIMRDPETGVLTGVSDPRRSGAAVGE